MQVQSLNTAPQHVRRHANLQAHPPRHMRYRSPSREPPSDFTLIPAGTPLDGLRRFLWTERSAQEVTKLWARLNRRFMWDYQHLSDKAACHGS